MRGYGAAWRRPRALLIGYSLGADVLPFLYTRLPADVRAAVRSVTLIGPGKTASFEFHVADWLDASAMRAMPVMPEIARIGDASILCIHGVEEADSPCPRLRGQRFAAVAVPGGHHFNGDYLLLVRRIVEHLRPAPGAAR